MPSHPAKLNNRLWITRVKRGLPRKKLAALIGHRTTSQLCRWEEGTQIPSLANALLLSHVLQTPVEFLFKGLRDELASQVMERRGTEDEESNNEGVNLTLEAVSNP